VSQEFGKRPPRAKTGAILGSNLIPGKLLASLDKMSYLRLGYQAICQELPQSWAHAKYLDEITCGFTIFIKSLFTKYR
jgi:hypothetical protein